MVTFTIEEGYTSTLSQELEDGELLEAARIALDERWDRILRRATCYDKGVPTAWLHEERKRFDKLPTEDLRLRVVKDQPDGYLAEGPEYLYMSCSGGSQERANREAFCRALCMEIMDIVQCNGRSVQLVIS